MSKLSLLSQPLVEKFGINASEADEFVAELFSIIREYVETDKIVKIKGLGTFKLAEMSARESIDVNTGERITIEGRNKLSFTPENAVRDLINSPFAQFESVELDDESVLNAIDDKYSSDLQPETVSPEPEVSAEEPKAEEPAPVVEEPQQEVIEPEVEVAQTVAIVEESAEEVQSEPETEEVEPEVKEVEPVVLQVVSEPVASEEPEQEVVEPVAPETVEPAEPKVAEEETPITETRSPFCENLIHEEIHHSKKIIKLLYWILGIMLAALVGFGGFCLYTMHGMMSTKENVPAETQKPKKEFVADTIPAKVKADTVAQKPVEAVAEETKPQYPDQTEYNKDARVRTGAYYIMGEDTVVTVVQGQTLKGISKAYLGDGMDCYVEAFNGGITSVKPGDKVRIPKVKLKKHFK